ncbi:hypothetical protein BCV72DRAFT_215773 [Rhizopus microsporus var. microsporus]|uniref:Uncharacterized protein n=1 Tax=Rhizopus microsporus var. microsporus TaxID=86635 RepID=A0A1X0QR27_RHIZD|nr:hypothetical protein BCV72DRAFT_215773 [Rhizopus microsporus var. microsporus]
MTEMVHWDQQEKLKREVKYNIQLLERQAQEEVGCDDTIATVKEMINTMKQIMNQCICQYYKWNTWIKMLIGIETTLWAMQTLATFLVIKREIHCLFLLL